ncbi:MAG: hypothetical protein NVV82_00270 [Sporocytophaga sp.]|nr:hypothetical protein [Sporocytophaga sp.]
MNIETIFSLVEKLGISPIKLLEGLKPYLVNLKEPLYQAVLNQERTKGNRVVYILYAEYDTNGNPTGRLLAQFNDVTEEGLIPFKELPFEELILEILTPDNTQQSLPSKS